MSVLSDLPTLAPDADLDPPDSPGEEWIVFALEVEGHLVDPRRDDHLVADAARLVEVARVRSDRYYSPPDAQTIGEACGPGYYYAVKTADVREQPISSRTVYTVDDPR